MTEHALARSDGFPGREDADRGFADVCGAGCPSACQSDDVWKPAGAWAVVVLGGGMVALVLPGSGLLLLGLGVVVLIMAMASQSAEAAEIHAVQAGPDMVSPRAFQAILTVGMGLVGLSVPLTFLQLSPMILMVPGVVLLVCATALTALGQTPTTPVGRRLAGGVLVCLLLLPFVAVGVMILTGADAMATYLLGYFLFLLVLVCTVCVLLMLFGLQGSRLVRQRRNDTHSGSS